MKKLCDGMRTLPPTPDKNDRRVLQFCEQLSPGRRPFYVPVVPEEDFPPLQCFPNVEKKTSRTGGKVIYGWEISQEPNVHLEAQFHAVWQSPQGEYVDVTPQLIEQSPILFVIDSVRTYTGQTVPDKRFALGDVALVQRYWVLIDQRAEILTQMGIAGFPPGHPLYLQRLGPLQNEIETIREKLNQHAG